MIDMLDVNDLAQMMESMGFSTHHKLVLKATFTSWKKNPDKAFEALASAKAKKLQQEAAATHKAQEEAAAAKKAQEQAAAAKKAEELHRAQEQRKAEERRKAEAAEAERKAEEARQAAAAAPARVPLPMQPAQPALTPHSPSSTTATCTRASLTTTPTPPQQSASMANFTAWTQPGSSAPIPPTRFTCARPTPGPPTPLFSQTAAPTTRLWHHQRAHLGQQVQAQT